MAILRNKDIKNMTKNDREKKMKELKLELVKSKGTSTKTGTSKTREIKKTIARIFTFNKTEGSEEKSSVLVKPKKQTSQKEVLNKK